MKKTVIVQPLPCAQACLVLLFPGSLLSNEAVNTTIFLPVLTLTSYLLAGLHWKRWYPGQNWGFCSAVLGFFLMKNKKTNPKQNCLLPRGAESFCWEDNTSTVSLSPLAIVTVGTGSAPVGCDWAMRSLGKAQNVTKPGCGIAVCHGQLRNGIIRKSCSCWGLQGKRRDQHSTGSAGEWELMIILCAVWVKQFLQTLLYYVRTKSSGVALGWISMEL